MAHTTCGSEEGDPATRRNTDKETTERGVGHGGGGWGDRDGRYGSIFVYPAVGHDVRLRGEAARRVKARFRMWGGGGKGAVG